MPNHARLDAKKKTFKRPNIAQNRTILNSLWKRELSKSIYELAAFKQSHRSRSDCFVMIVYDKIGKKTIPILIFRYTHNTHMALTHSQIIG